MLILRWKYKGGRVIPGVLSWCEFCPANIFCGRQILEKKTRDRVLQHVWAAWAQLVSDARAEVETAEVREQQDRNPCFLFA